MKKTEELQAMIKELCPEDIYIKRADVEYGNYGHETYFSGACGLERNYSVLLPWDYSEEKKYPVLYLLHGIFGDEFMFGPESGNNINQILYNLVFEGEAREWIIIMPDMFAKKDPEEKPQMNADSIKSYDFFINDLIGDLMPFVEKKYSVLTGRENTAIAGFSLGGRETLFISLQESGRFGYVGAFAPAPGLVPGKDWAMEHSGQMSEKDVNYGGERHLPDVLMICCGTQDKVVGDFPKSYHELYEKNGIPHVWYEVPGEDHNSVTIMSGFFNFLRLIGA